VDAKIMSNIPPSIALFSSFLLPPRHPLLQGRRPYAAVLKDLSGGMERKACPKLGSPLSRGKSPTLVF